MIRRADFTDFEDHSNPTKYFLCFLTRKDAFERRTTTGSEPFSLLGQRITTLTNTNLVASRHTIREKTSLPVDVLRSKTPLLNPLSPNIHIQILKTDIHTFP